MNKGGLMWNGKILKAGIKAGILALNKVAEIKNYRKNDQPYQIQ